MRQKSGLVFLAAVVCLSPAVHSQQIPASANKSGPPAPVATFKATSRLVNVEVVAKDHKGQLVKGLTADDFQLFEQEPGWRKEKRPQKIAAVRAINILEAPTQPQDKLDLPPGIYTNLVTLQKNPVPPTIVLVDALNTPWADRVQVRIQMVRMLRTIPEDVPVAVFLLGRQLLLLQNFTSDPKLLKSALEKSSGAQAGDLAQTDPRDDPNALSAILEDIPGARVDTIERFEQEAFAGEMDVRERITIEALRSLARHVAGYPGRKNLLWISSSFPLALNPDLEAAVTGGTRMYGAGERDYQADIQEVSNLLGEAKIAVYPIDPGGLPVPSLSKAETRPRGIGRGSNAMGSIYREDNMRENRVNTMQTMADTTGGRVCVNDNDLGDCVKKAVDDSSYFYEIAYYPDSKDWHGEFRKIVVEAKQSGLHLSYRRGYYATPEPITETHVKKQEEQLQKTACGDLLTSTSVPLAAKAIPAEQPGTKKYFLSVDTGSLGVDQSPKGGPQLELQFAACTFDKAGKPLQFWHDSVSQELTAKQYAGMQSGHAYLHILAMSPSANAIAVRLLVRDLITGKVGSLNVPLTETAAALPSSATPAATSTNGGAAATEDSHLH